MGILFFTKRYIKIHGRVGDIKQVIWHSFIAAPVNENHSYKLSSGLSFRIKGSFNLFARVIRRCDIGGRRHTVLSVIGWDYQSSLVVFKSRHPGLASWPAWSKVLSCPHHPYYPSSYLSAMTALFPETRKMIWLVSWRCRGGVMVKWICPTGLLITWFVVRAPPLD